MDKALRRNVTGAIQRREGSLDIFERHKLRVARDSMRRSCAGLAVLGGPNHYQAAAIIHTLTGAFVGIDADCTCDRDGAIV
jgi:hypothetical protein